MRGRPLRHSRPALTTTASAGRSVMGSTLSPTSRSPVAVHRHAGPRASSSTLRASGRRAAGIAVQPSSSGECAGGAAETPWMWATGSSISSTAARGSSPRHAAQRTMQNSASLRAAEARREAAARGAPESERFPAELRATILPVRRRALRQSVVMRGTDQLLRPLRMLAPRGDASLSLGGSSSPSASPAPSAAVAASARSAARSAATALAAAVASAVPAPAATGSAARRHPRRSNNLVVNTSAEPLAASARYRAHSTSAPGELLGQEARAKRDLLDEEVRDRVAPLPSPPRVRSRIAALSCAKSTGGVSAESGERSIASSRPSSRGSRGSRGSSGSLGSDASVASDWERSMAQRNAPPESLPCLRAAHFAVRRALDARRAACAAAAEAAAVVGAAMTRTAHLRDKSTVAVGGIVLSNPSLGVATDGGWHDDGASVSSAGTSVSLKMALRMAAVSGAGLPFSQLPPAGVRNSTT